MTMEESITKNNSVEEEPSMAFEKQSLEKSKKAENMIGKVFTNLSTKPTLTLAKVLFINLIVYNAFKY
jgi:hypothetical protein